MSAYNRRMPRQPRPSIRPWRASLREMVLIVASILIASFPDAWWDERIEARALDEMQLVDGHLEHIPGLLDSAGAQ